MPSFKRAGAALAAVVLLAGCAPQHAEIYDEAQCQALGGSLVREPVDLSQRRQAGFRVERQRCVFPSRQGQSP